MRRKRAFCCCAFPLCRAQNFRFILCYHRCFFTKCFKIYTLGKWAGHCSRTRIAFSSSTCRQKLDFSTLTSAWPLFIILLRVQGFSLNLERRWPCRHDLFIVSPEKRMQILRGKCIFGSFGSNFRLGLRKRDFLEFFSSLQDSHYFSQPKIIIFG